jgi:hypothetical protein
MPFHKYDSIMGLAVQDFLDITPTPTHTCNILA